MLVTELSSTAFDTAMSYAPYLISDMQAFANCEDQEEEFAELCMQNDVDFRPTGEPVRLHWID
jgi:hypothetical protein